MGVCKCNMQISTNKFIFIASCASLKVGGKLQKLIKSNALHQMKNREIECRNVGEGILSFF